MTGWIGFFGAPPDAVSWAAAGLALVCALLAWREPRWLRRALAAKHHPRIVGGLAITAAALSIGYVEHYLKGGPRIIDATSYYLEARSMARGWLAFPVPSPLASFQGRFLVGPPGASELGVIFPPGYPAVLAIGFLAGVPLLIGPAIAAGLVWVTHALAREVTDRDDVALLAATLSTVSAVLRYHTADTMSHGWCALLYALATLAALRSNSRWWIVGGIATGWLFASRPVSGLALLVLLGAILARKRAAWTRFFVALIPGLLLLVLHQHAVTGQWFVSSQRLYYHLADGPPGCFTYGFGPNVGCRFEHGEYVQAVMPQGYGWVEALRTTWARLHAHQRDAANLQPLVVFLVAGVVGIARNRRLWIPTIGVAAIVLAYLPFYYDGSYPGGGVRLYVDALPLEHILIAQGFFLLGAWRWAPALALVGFATQTAFDHRALSLREGGRPMFEPSVLRDAGIDRGLLFLGTDHGFNLAFDPGRRDPRREVVAARFRGDAHDRLLWEKLGRPPAYRYLYDPQTPVAKPSVEPYDIGVSTVLRFEAEHLWPPRRVEGGWVQPTFPGCASRHRGLWLRSRGASPVGMESQVVVPAASAYLIRLGWAAARDGAVHTTVQLGGAEMTDKSSRRLGQCWEQSLGRVELPMGAQRIVVWSAGDAAVLDFVELRPVP